MSACLLQHVKKIFSSKKSQLTALEDVSLEIEEGELYMITGPSRSGKSTLLSIMAGLMEPTEGHSEILGSNIFQLNRKERAEFRLRNLGLVFQTPELLLTQSLLENVMVPLRLIGMGQKSALKRALELLGQMGLSEVKDALPIHLSEAEKSLAAIARSLVLMPKLLIYDEPTASLDHPTSVKILTFLKELAYDHEITVIAAITDVRLHPFAGRVAKMKEGKITFISGETYIEEHEPPFLKL